MMIKSRLLTAYYNQFISNGGKAFKSIHLLINLQSNSSL